MLQTSPTYKHSSLSLLHNDTQYNHDIRQQLVCSSHNVSTWWLSLIPRPHYSCASCGLEKKKGLQTFIGKHGTQLSVLAGCTYKMLRELNGNANLWCKFWAINYLLF